MGKKAMRFLRACWGACLFVLVAALRRFADSALAAKHDDDQAIIRSKVLEIEGLKGEGQLKDRFIAMQADQIESLQTHVRANIEHDATRIALAAGKLKGFGG